MRNPNSWGCYTADFPEEYYKVNIIDAITIQQLVRTFMKKNALNKTRIAEARSSIRK